MRTNITGGSPFEPIIGFSRAVRVGNNVHLAGTGPVGADNEDAAAQTRRIFAIAEKALGEAGASFEDVVRTRVYLRDAGQWEAVARAHGRYFGSTRPVNTMLQIARLIGDYEVEIEAEAVVG